jgi:hypothetical protein
MYKAINNRRYELARWLITERNASVELARPLALASSNCDLRAVEMLLEASADPNNRFDRTDCMQRHGKTSLMCALSASYDSNVGDCAAVIELLLERTDLSLRDLLGRSHYHYLPQCTNPMIRRLYDKFMLKCIY